MNIRPHALRAVFALSVLLTAFWLVGLAWDSITGRDLAIPRLVIAGVLVAVGVSLFAFRGGRLAIPAQLGVGAVVRTFIPRLIGAYVTAVPIVGLLTWLLLRAFSREPGSSETGTLIGLMALWLPLWFAPALGVEWWWHTMRERGLA
jgi:hypothetical protein